ncbi:penicillin acylase family protein [Rhodovulum sp. P5]|uniref:penicillin acylase family protein n=1 Tax=Rhodovulum sp. P5 TaxID=1564506 RepID=UPI0015602D07|nr:penicillin acylase family protein [Rhodovulum sp. P5]
MAIGAAVSAVAFSIGAILLVGRSLPDYDGVVPVSGLPSEVTIARTENAIPHIYADRDASVFYGLGYAHAQDRMWQMEVLRRLSQGRLSELVGAKALRADELLRRMDLHGAARASLAVQEPLTLDWLDAYAAGVNAYIETHRGFGAAAPEFLLFPTELEIWEPADSLALMKLLALQLASHVDREVLRARVARRVGPERLADILPDDPHGAIVAIPDLAWLDQTLGNGVATHGDLWLPGLGRDWSSNAWAVGPSRSVTGASLLANDPHLDYSAPSIWYLARLGLSGGDVIGATIPGLPAVLSGRKATLAWGITAANMDDQDVYLERLNPDDATEVLTPSGYRPLRVEAARLHVRGGDPVDIELHWSENGPILPDRYYDFSTITPPGHVVAIARTLFDREDRTMSAVHRLLQAGTVESAIEAMRDFVTPAMNLSLADPDHIALQVVGRMPRRGPGHETLGRMPSRGWIAANRWDGYLPYADSPRVVDPVSGVIGNTNNKTADRPFPQHVSFDWGDTQRIHRLAEALGARDLHDRQSMKALQGDTVSPPVRTVLPAVLKAIRADDPRLQRVVGMLREWDGRMRADRPEPLIYAALLRQLQIDLTQDELGPDIEGFTHPRIDFLQRVFSDTDGAAIWCDDISTPVAETCADMATRALRAVLDGLDVTSGAQVEALRWGDDHIATHDHTVLGQVPGLGPLVNIRHAADGGDHTLKRGRTSGKPAAPFRDVHGSGYRAIYDMGDPDRSLFVISTGQSGHPLSRHYRDLWRIWHRGEYVPMDLTPASDAAFPTVLRLTPKRQ